MLNQTPKTQHSFNIKTTGLNISLNFHLIIMQIFDIQNLKKFWTVSLSERYNSDSKFITIPKDITKILKLEKGEKIFISLEEEKNEYNGKRIIKMILLDEKNFETLNEKKR